MNRQTKKKWLENVTGVETNRCEAWKRRALAPPKAHRKGSR